MGKTEAELTLSSEHSCFHRREDLQLGANGWDALAHLEQVLKIASEVEVSAQHFATNRSHALVRALLGQLLGQPGHLVRGLRNRLGDGDQLSLAATVLLRE